MTTPKASHPSQPEPQPPGTSAVGPPVGWRQLLSSTESHMLIGRAGGMSYGFASGLGHLDVVLCNLVVETAQVLVVYPLFVLAWRQLIDVRRMAPMLEQLRAATESGQTRVRRYGIAGLFVFVFMPFWMTGPVVGAIIGFLIGLRPAVNLAVVLSATALAIVALAVLAWLARRWWRRHGPPPGPGE